MKKSKANLHRRRRNRDGFSAVELIITATVVTIVTAFGVMGINRAQASIHLSGSVREYASYIEKARLFSIRSHADDASERASIVINENKTSYDITMDLDGDGDLDTRTITLPSGIEFVKAETVAFDWRGRTYNTVDGMTFAKAQVSIRLKNRFETASVDITGSGDVTVNSAVFDDEVPNVTLNVGDLAAGGTPVPTPSSSIVPSASPTDTTPATTTSPSPVDSTGTTGTTPPTSITPTPTSTPTPTPTPTPTATPSPSPTAQQGSDICTISADQSLLSLSAEGTTIIKVSHNASTSISITATSSKPSDLQVTPGGAQSVAAGGSVTYTVKSKKKSGDYSVTFKASCGQTSVPVSVQ